MTSSARSLKVDNVNRLIEAVRSWDAFNMEKMLRVASNIAEYARLDRFLDKGDQARCRGILHPPHADAPDSFAVFLRSDDNQCLTFGLTAANVLFHRAQIRFVDFHRTLQPLPPWPHHSPAQLV